MPLLLPEGWTVVPDAEYALLCLLPTFSKRGEDVLYRNECGIDYFVWRQSAYDRMQELTRQVDGQCAELDEPSPIELPELPVVPAPPAPNIPQCDLDAYALITRPPVVNGQSARPRDGGSSLGFGRLDISRIFDR
jgi:hypothetical protein